MPNLSPFNLALRYTLFSQTLCVYSVLSKRFRTSALFEDELKVWDCCRLHLFVCLKLHTNADVCKTNLDIGLAQLWPDVGQGLGRCCVGMTVPRKQDGHSLIQAKECTPRQWSSGELWLCHIQQGRNPTLCFLSFRPLFTFILSPLGFHPHVHTSISFFQGERKTESWGNNLWSIKQSQCQTMVKSLHFQIRIFPERTQHLFAVDIWIYIYIERESLQRFIHYKWINDRIVLYGGRSRFTGNNLTLVVLL